MITLITGGSKCGKSRYAEDILTGFDGRRIYVAAMQPYGEEAHEAIARHRRLRAGKGFETIERYTDIGELQLPQGCAVLLECVGNLCANEMFRDGKMYRPADKISAEIQLLAARAEELVIVTNQVGSDGISYAEGTAAYMAEMEKINRSIAVSADCVIECVYGIPLVLKGALPCSGR